MKNKQATEIILKGGKRMKKQNVSKTSLRRGM